MNVYHSRSRCVIGSSCSVVELNRRTVSIQNFFFPFIFAFLYITDDHGLLGKPTLKYLMFLYCVLQRCDGTPKTTTIGGTSGSFDRVLTYLLTKLIYFFITAIFYKCLSNNFFIHVYKSHWVFVLKLKMLSCVSCMKFCVVHIYIYIFFWWLKAQVMHSHKMYQFVNNTKFIVIQNFPVYIL